MSATRRKDAFHDVSLRFLCLPPVADRDPPPLQTHRPPILALGRVGQGDPDRLRDRTAARGRGWTEGLPNSWGGLYIQV